MSERGIEVGIDHNNDAGTAFIPDISGILKFPELLRKTTILFVWNKASNKHLIVVFTDKTLV